MAKFEEARALISSRPGGRVSFEAVFEAGLDAFLDRKSPTRRKARREKRRAKNQAPASQPERVESRAPTGKLEPNESGLPGGQVGRVGASGGRVERAEPGVSAAKTKRVESGSPGGQILSRRSRHVPVDVRDEVYVRDEGRCTYVGPNGQRCGARFRVQVDHIEPFGLLGPSTETNLRLLCAEHNLLEAERVYGRDKIRSFVAKNPQPLRR